MKEATVASRTHTAALTRPKRMSRVLQCRREGGGASVRVAVEAVCMMPEFFFFFSLSMYMYVCIERERERERER
jgi:hypothetical protein